MHDRDVETVHALGAADDRKAVDRRRPVADGVEIQLQPVAAAQAGFQCRKQLAGGGFGIHARIGAAEIRAGDDAALGRLAHVQPLGQHQAVEQLLVRLRMDDQAGRRLDRQFDAGRRGDVRRADAGRDHHLVGGDQAMRCVHAGNPAAGLDQRRDRAGEDPRAVPFGVGQQRFGGGHRLGDTFFGDMQGEIGKLRRDWARCARRRRGRLGSMP